MSRLKGDGTTTCDPTPSFWVDREQGVVGVYFATCLDMDANTGDLRWDFDLFQNLVTAAVID